MIKRWEEGSLRRLAVWYVLGEGWMDGLMIERSLSEKLRGFVRELS